ncbi:MAG: hypothetical protein Q8941_03480 [Bacteroidota bacterium]|nr:hypothetical protein [Bacteroidota bacterium]
MKRIIISCSYLFTAAMLFTACRKSDNPKLPALTRFPLPVVTKVTTGADQVISAQSPAAFTGKFTVDMFFKNDVPAQKLDVVAIKNGNKAVVKTIQANVTTYPSTITITGTQLATLFGSPIVLGDKFDISVDVTAGGVKYEAFPLTGAPYASGVASQPGSSTFIRYEAVCQYNPSQYQGNFVVVSDDWADYSPGDNVPLTMIDATHFSFKYLADNAQPIIVTVNPVTNAVSVAKQVYGSGYGGASWPYGNISCESVPGVDDFVAPCSGIFSVRLKHTVAAGSFGEAVIVLQKP